MAYYNLKFDGNYTPYRTMDDLTGAHFTELDDCRCPECGEDMGEPEEIYGKYWPEENYQEIDAYKYTCPECGKVFYTKERL